MGGTSYLRHAQDQRRCLALQIKDCEMHQVSIIDCSILINHCLIKPSDRSRRTMLLTEEINTDSSGSR